MSYAGCHWWYCRSGSYESKKLSKRKKNNIHYCAILSKAVTGKFMPIRQFLYFDAIECLPEDVFQPSDSTPASVPKMPTKKTRYYSQELVFGEDFQEKICKSNYFVVRVLL